MTKPYYIRSVMLVVGICPDGNLVTENIPENRRDRFGEEYVGVGLRTQKVGKYTVVYSRHAKSRGEAKNYLATRFCRIPIYGMAYVLSGYIFGVPLCLSREEAEECTEALESVFVRKRKKR